jgi:hypothetical protein
MLRTVLLLATLAISQSAYAQDARLPSPAPNPGRAEDERACGPDARKLCRQVLSQGDMAVLACFQQNRAQLSRACDAVLRKHGQ